jgi:hypothetical protein
MEMSPEVDALVELYKRDAHALSQLELAKREKEIWSKIREQKLQGTRTRPEILSILLGGTTYQIGNRQYVLAGGAVADVLWKRIDQKTLTLSAARKILLEAKRAAHSSGEPVDAVMARVLKRYDELPFTMQRSDGTVYRRAKFKTVKKNVIKNRLSTKQLLRESANDESVWAIIRREMNEFLASKIKNSGSILIDEITREFEIALRQLIGEFRHKVRSAEAVDKSWLTTTSISQEEMESACAILKIDPPLDGGPVDLHVANQMKKRLARAYHPDVHGETTREQFEAVLRAYDVLEEYNGQFEKVGESKNVPTEKPTDAVTDQRDDGNRQEEGQKGS